MIRWKGKCNNIEALQWLDVPEDAVLLREPKNINTFMILVVILSLLLYILLEVAFILKYGRITEIDSLYLLIGAITAILMIIPHEYIHAIAFPSDANVDIWYIPKKLMAFVCTTAPISKWQFIYISLLPNLILGIVPFIVWLITPWSVISASMCLFAFSAVSLLIGVGDYINIFNVLVQMPKGTYIQASGSQSYWFYKSVEEELR